MIVRVHSLPWLLVATLLLFTTPAQSAALRQDELFNLTNVWTVHLTFTPAQWETMEPKQTGAAVERRAGGQGGPRLLAPEGGRNGLSGARGIEFDYAKANLEFGASQFTNVAVRYKGNGTYMRSQNSAKHSLKIDLNKFVPGQKLAAVSKLNLHNNVTDVSWMRETLSYQLYREAGVPAPRTSYAMVYVTVPGTYEHEYFGLYSLVENIDNDFTEKNFKTKKGAIFKPVTRDLFSDLGTDWTAYKQIYDAKTGLTAAQMQRVFDFAKLVTHADDREFAARVSEFLDLEEFARFMAVTVYLSSLDSILGMGQNFYVYLDAKSKRFQFIPWDLDNSFGKMGGPQEAREQLSIMQPWQGENRFVERVFKVETFQKVYRARLAGFSRTIFQPERFTNQVNTVAAALRGAVKEESAEQLARFDQAVAGESVARWTGGPGERDTIGVRGRGGFGSANSIKAFVAIRSQSVIDQVAGKSEGQVIVRGMGRRQDGPGGGRQAFPP